MGWSVVERELGRGGEMKLGHLFFVVLFLVVLYCFCCFFVLFLSFSPCSMFW